MLESGLDSLGAPIAAGDHLIELATSCCDKRELGSDEKPVDRDQSKYGNHAARRDGHRGRIDGLRRNESKDHICVIYIVVET